MTISYNRPVTINSNDGGGVRGIIQAAFYEEIEKRTKKEMSQLFDVIGGSSTGALTAATFNIPKSVTDKTPKYTASDLVKLYDTEAAKIFYRPFSYRVTNMDGFRGPFYPTAGINSVLENYFGNLKFSDSLTEMVVPCRETTVGKDWIFTRHQARHNKSLNSIMMKQILRATTAAPTYFSSKTITIDKTNYEFIDGGVVSNNPTALIYAEAKKQFNQPENCLILSVGTGKYPIKLPAQKTKTMGKIGWIENGIIEQLLVGPSQAAHKMMKLLFPEKGTSQKYYRFNAKIDIEHTSLNNSSKENLNYLKEQTKEMIEENDEKIHELCNKLEKASECKK